MKKMRKILALILVICALVTVLPASLAEEIPPAQLELPGAGEDARLPEPGFSEEAPEAQLLSVSAGLPTEEIAVETVDPSTADMIPDRAAEPSAENSSPAISAEPSPEETPVPTVPAAEAVVPAEPSPKAAAEASPEPSPASIPESAAGIPSESEADAELPAAAEAAELFPEKIFLLMGETYQLAAAQHPDYAGRLRYAQDDGYKRFLIDENGLITALDQGEEHLSVYMNDNLLFNCRISIGYAELPPVPISKIVLPEKSISLHTSDYREIWPQILPAGAVGTLQYSFSDPEIAEAEYNPLRIYGLRAGETTLTITADSGASASLKVSVEYVEPYFRIDENGVLTYAGDDNRIVEVPDGVTAIGPQAFRYHSSTKTVILPESCTRIDNEAFYASSIRQIILPESLTSIGKKAFMDSRLQSISLPTGIKTIDDQAFSGTMLQSVDLPEGLESIGGGAFSKTDIKKLRLPGSLGVLDAFPASDVEEIEFCEGITEVRCVAALGYNETGIRKVIFPSTIEYIYPHFFEQGIYTDQKIKIFGYSGSAAEEFCASHSDKSKFSFIPLDSVREDENFRIEGSVLAAYKGDASEVVVPEGVTVIGREAFAGKTHVTSVTLPEGLTDIQTSAFKGCTGLRKINLPESLQLIDENAFHSCSSLLEINFPTSLKTIRNYAFFGCASLTSLTIPGSLDYVGVDCFKNCTDLEHVVYLKGYTHVGGFAGCTSLASITIPEGVTSIGDNAFRGCGSLKEIALPESLKSIGSHVFTGSSLGEISIPENVSNMSYSAFENCTTLRRVSIPHKLYRAYPQLFKGCSALTSVYIPNGIKQLNTEAFMNCPSLKSVYVPASVNEIEENVFLNCPNLTVVTPSGSSAAKYCQTNGIPWAKPDAVASAVSFPEGDLTLGVGQVYQLKCEADSNLALGTITYSSSSAKVVSVDKVTGEIKALKTGSATITAKAQSGAKASCRVTVKKAPASVAFAEKEVILGYGESVQLSCILPKDTAAGLTFEGSNFFALHVDPDGRITAVGTGSDNVTVTTHNGKTASCTVIVAEAPKQVILENEKISIPQTLSHQLKPTVNAGSICRSFSYTSSMPEIATVDENGLISAHAMGTAEITVSVAAAPEIFAVCSVTVTDPPPRIVLSAEEITLGLKETFALNPGYEGDFAGSFSCASSNSKVAAISSDGVVTAKKAGTAVITVAGENGLSAECSVTVKKAPASIQLNTADLKLGAGESAQLSYTLSSGSAGSVSFVSSNPEIAEVCADGSITAKAPGSTEILARTYNGKKASVKLTVYVPPESVSLDRIGNPLKLGVGESGTLGVKFSEGSFGSCSFVSSDSGIVEIDANGSFRARMLGECSISVTAYNGVSETRKVQVCMPPKKVEFDSLNDSVIGVGQQYRLFTYYYAEGNEPCGPGLSFKSSNEKVATVDVNGVVTGLKPGSATITVTSFNGKKDSWKMTVKKAPAGISLNADTLQLGYCESFPLEAVLSPSGSWGNVQFSISDERAAYFDDGMLVANRGSGSATVTATTFNGLSDTVTIHFGPMPGYVKFPQEEITLCVGMQLPLEFESDGCFSTYSVKTSDKKIAYVDDGMLIAKKKGSAEITVTTYNMVQATLKVRVEAAPKKHVLNLPSSLKTGKRYNLLDYFSSTPSYDPMLLIRSVSLNNSKALITKDADGWYLTPMETGSIILTIKTLNSSLRIKTAIVPGLDPDLPDITSPVDTSAVFSDYIGTWKLACLGSISDGMAIPPETMGVNPYIINVRPGEADIISDDNSLYGFPAFMDGHILILDTIGNKIPSQLHQNGYLTLPQKTEGVHLWFERQ